MAKITIKAINHFYYKLKKFIELYLNIPSGMNSRSFYFNDDTHLLV